MDHEWSISAIRSKYLDDDKHISSMRNFHLGLFVLITYMVHGVKNFRWLHTWWWVKEKKKMCASKCKSATSSAKINDTEQIPGNNNALSVYSVTSYSQDWWSLVQCISTVCEIAWLLKSTPPSHVSGLVCKFLPPTDVSSTAYIKSLSHLHRSGVLHKISNNPWKKTRTCIGSAL